MISGKSFADKCKWVFDPRYPERPSFDYRRANHGDWVFVNGDYITELSERIPFQLLNAKKFVFVVHNSDLSFGPIQFHQLFQHAVHIYAINTTFQDPMVTTIPLGFVDRQLPLLPGFRGGSSDREYEVYANFTVTTNSIKRKECLECFKDDPRLVYHQNLSVPEYFMDLCKSKFVLCPEGTGMDTHRVYEALYCGATPVVLHGPLDNLYQTLPVCIVNSWTDSFVVPNKNEVKWNASDFL